MQRLIKLYIDKKHYPHTICCGTTLGEDGADSYMPKKNNIYRGMISYQSEFDHRYACWAYNHRGWAKAKKSNKKNS